jgi:hypothetical protein
MYYECHITTDPVEGEQLETFQEVSRKFQFRVAKLLMRKTLQPSGIDSFCTSRSHDYEEMEERMLDCANHLQESGIHVRRYKIEAVIYDQRLK